MATLEIFKQTHLMLDAAVALNKKLRQEIDKTCFIRNESYAYEHCSVYFDIGRMCGKSEWIIKTATPEDLIVVVSDDMARYRFSCAISDVMTIEQVFSEVDVKSYENVFFDCSRYMNSDDIFSVYRKLIVSEKEQTFVHVG